VTTCQLIRVLLAYPSDNIKKVDTELDYQPKLPLNCKGVI